MAVGDRGEEATEKLQRAVDKLDQKMGTETKWSQVGTCVLYQQKMSTYTNNYKWQSHT